jgi:hypothetical protein
VVTYEITERHKFPSRKDVRQYNMMSTASVLHDSTANAHKDFKRSSR